MQKRHLFVLLLGGWDRGSGLKRGRTGMGEPHLWQDRDSLLYIRPAVAAVHGDYLRATENLFSPSGTSSIFGGFPFG